MAENCLSCNEVITGKYCSNCGQKAKLDRINGHYIKHEIEHVLHLEKGIFFTVKELILRPGKTVRSFISENRTRLVKPIIFVIVTSLIYSLLSHAFHMDTSYISLQNADSGSAVNYLDKWVNEHYGYSNLMMSLFIGLWIRLFFRNYDYNFYEILILLCFVMGICMLVFSICTILEGLTHVSFYITGSVIFLIYATWAIGDFFDRSRKKNYFKALGAYVLGMLSFSFLVTLLGLLIDFLIKIFAA